MGHRLGGDVEVAHDAGVHGDEVDLGDVAVQAAERLVDQPALVGDHQLGGALGQLGLLLVPGHQHPLAQGGDHLHGGDAAAGGEAGGALHGQRGDAGQLVDAVQAVFVEEHGVAAVDVPAPEQVDLPPAVDDLPVGQVGALGAVLDAHAGVAAEGQRQAPVLAQLEQAGQQPGVAPQGEQQVGVVLAQDGGQVEQQRAGMRQAEAAGEALAAHQHVFGRGVRRVHVGLQAQQAQRGRGRLQVPGGVQHLQGADFAFRICLDPAVGQREGAVGGGMVQRQGQVGVVEIQVGEAPGGAAEEPGLLGGVRHPGRQHGQRLGAEQVAALGAGERCLPRAGTGGSATTGAAARTARRRRR